jgi:hypothetical protein
VSPLAKSIVETNVMSRTVQELFQRIQNLSEDDRLELEEQLTQWTETKHARDQSAQPRYPLRGSVVRYENPTGPVAENDWDT